MFNCIVRDSVQYLSAWKVKNAERWKIEKEKKYQVIQKGGEGGGLNLRAADIFMHTRDQNFFSATAVLTAKPSGPGNVFAACKSLTAYNMLLNTVCNENVDLLV